MTAVKDTLEDRYTENMENIYKITVHFILETLIAGYEEAESEDVNSNTKQLEDNQDATT